MRNLVVIVFGLLFVSIFFSNCKKYPEDGAPAHLLTARERLCRIEWYTNSIYNKYNLNISIPYGANNCPNCDKIKFSLTGKFDGTQSTIFGFKGKWKFTNHKDELYIYDDNNSLTFTIDELDPYYLKLEKDSFIYTFIQP